MAEKYVVLDGVVTGIGGDDGVGLRRGQVFAGDPTDERIVRLLGLEAIRSATPEETKLELVELPAKGAPRRLDATGYEERLAEKNRVIAEQVARINALEAENADLVQKVTDLEAQLEAATAPPAKGKAKGEEKADGAKKSE